MAMLIALLYLLKASLAAAVKTPLRILAYWLLSLVGLVDEQPYSQAAARSSGYISSVSTSWGHCLAFRRADTKRLQFYW